MDIAIKAESAQPHIGLSKSGCASMKTDYMDVTAICKLFFLHLPVVQAFLLIYKRANAGQHRDMRCNTSCIQFLYFSHQEETSLNLCLNAAADIGSLPRYQGAIKLDKGSVDPHSINI